MHHHFYDSPASPPQFVSPFDERLRSQHARERLRRTLKKNREEGERIRRYRQGYLRDADIESRRRMF